MGQQQQQLRHKSNRKMYQVDGMDLNEDAHFC
jgi:hypothetical protein